MSAIVSKLNQNSDEFILAGDLAEIKSLLTKINETVGGSNKAEAENLYLQYPESSADYTLAASGTYTREVTVNRKLKYLTVSIPTDCILTVYNDNNLWGWFTDEAGTLEIFNGITFGALKIVVKNTDTSNAKRWTCRMLFV